MIYYIQAVENKRNIVDDTISFVILKYTFCVTGIHSMT